MDGYGLITQMGVALTWLMQERGQVAERLDGVRSELAGIQFAPPPLDYQLNSAQAILVAAPIAVAPPIVADPAPAQVDWDDADEDDEVDLPIAETEIDGAGQAEDDLTDDDWEADGGWGDEDPEAPEPETPEAEIDETMASPAIIYG